MIRNLHFISRDPRFRQTCVCVYETSPLLVKKKMPLVRRERERGEGERETESERKRERERETQRGTERDR